MSIRNKIRPFQSSFKIVPQHLNLEGGPDTRSKSFTPRKAHQKSRNGCQACKGRRVKCDEKKPSCNKCVKLGLDCIYASNIVTQQTDASLRGENASGLVKSPSSEMYSMAVDLVETDIDRLLFQSMSFEDTRSGNARILHHFQNATSTTLGCNATKLAMQSYVGMVAWDASYLMHIVLAISCAHQRYLGIPTCPIAEAEHWSHGLRRQQENFAKLVSGESRCSPDQVIATTMLTIMYTFCLDEELPLDALSSTDVAFEQFLAPLAANGGFRSMSFLYPEDLRACPAFMDILCSSDDAEGTFTSEQPGLQGLPRAFVELCEIDEGTTCESNPYHKIVRHLAPLLRLAPHPDNFVTLMAFLGRTWPNFRPLVTGRDGTALLLLSYWLALLRQIDQWWVSRRAYTACRAVVSYLSQTGDDKIISLLPFPSAFESGDMPSMWRILRPVASDTIS